MIVQFKLFFFATSTFVCFVSIALVLQFHLVGLLDTETKKSHSILAYLKNDPFSVDALSLNRFLTKTNVEKDREEKQITKDQKH